MRPEERNDPQEIFLNGVDFVTGSYLAPPVTLHDLVQIAQSELRQVPQGEQKALKLAQKRKSAKTYGFAANLDDIQEANWGVIFAQDESVEVRNAFQALIEHRSRQIGKDAPVFTYRPGWSANQFLAYNGVQSGFGDAETVPYYLLLVGGPERIPWRVQYELAGEYGVGRLAFEQAADYQDYVDRLIDYETSAHVPNRREAVFWATANQSAIGWKDQATQLSSSVLAQGLFDSLPDSLGTRKTMLRSAEATKSCLADQLSREQPPVLLFTASHGLGFSAITPDQPRLQGALITQDWKTDHPATRNDFFCADDLLSLPKMNVRGMVHFAFACYSAGTPKNDDYSYGTLQPIADRPFAAQLPAQILRNGALAFIGHIDRAWGFSFIDQNDQPMLEGYKRALFRILKGKYLGHALRDQYDRGIQLSAGLMEDLSDMEWGKEVLPLDLANRWVERNDARAYCLMGDPGAHIRVQEIG